MTDPTDAVPSRDELGLQYLETLPFEPYPLQEEAISAWFDSEQGVLVCAPTGTGKTVVAEAALFEALHSRKRAYYTTPLIALCEQKFRELQEKVVSWGFFPEDVGLVTGNRRENPDAPIIVAVAEILFNRLLHTETFEFDDVSAVVMDEFHSFNDIERGIVWELSLSMLPEHVRLMLLSATVGNAYDFVAWLRNAHHRKIELVQGTERRVPLTFSWVEDQLLPEFLESMVHGGDDEGFTPALVFCFNRDQCWDVAEQIKGRSILQPGQQAKLAEELAKYKMTTGIGPKMRQLLLRGVGVHHAGVLPKYRRIVEDLFQKKLLAFATCTETLAAGINLPARSVVVPSLMKGPKGKKRLLDPSTAHQIFGRAGRPQYDSQGFVFALAHEDDVRMNRWRVRYDQIPENTKDPGLIKAKKALKKKQPKKSPDEQYWTEAQYDKLRDAKPVNLASHGLFPWRLLAYLLDFSPDLEKIRDVVRHRLMSGAEIEAGLRDLDRMLVTLWDAGLVRLDPAPPTSSHLAESNGTNTSDATQTVDSNTSSGGENLSGEVHLNSGDDVYTERLDVAWNAVPKTQLLEVRRSDQPVESLMDLAWYRTPDNLPLHGGASKAGDSMVWTGSVTTVVKGDDGPDAWDALDSLLEEELDDSATDADSFDRSADESSADESLDDVKEQEMEPRNSNTVGGRQSDNSSESECSDRNHFSGENNHSDDASGSSREKGVAEESLSEDATGPSAKSPTTLFGTSLDIGTRDSSGGKLPASKSNEKPKLVASQASESDRVAEFQRAASGQKTETPATDSDDDESPMVEITWRKRPEPKLELPELAIYTPRQAWAAPQLSMLTGFRSVNPLYGMFLLSHLGIASREERIQAFESVLEMPGTVARSLRVPRQDTLPPGPLATQRLHPAILARGLASHEELVYTPRDEEEEYSPLRSYDERPKWVLTLAEKLFLLFDADYPGVHSLSITPVWAAGEILEFRDFDKFITSRGLQKQEGMVFRHLLRMILLLDEFYAFIPPDTMESEWRGDLEEMMVLLTDVCRRVDPSSTEQMLARTTND
ncbi:MAG: DEAD/DEAH box helicase [Thermoguttaceae bacterium]|nr:DEAD/DEAH box helicase [Thermoguttaceae bacterium]